MNGFKKMAAALALGAIAVSGAFAGGQQAAPAKTKDKTIKFLTIWAEDRDNSKLIMELTREYQKEHPEFKVDFELVAITDIRQKVKVLLAANDLPDAFIYESGRPIVELIDAGVLVDLEAEFKKMGIFDSLDPGAVSLLKSLALGRGLYDLPLGMNMEGFWYNKKVFKDLGLSVPKTWDDMLAAAEKIKAAGVQPFTAGGKDKWPLTRVVNAYVMRKMGVDAMDKAVAGELSFTDPGFIEAARVVQDMAKKGYFGPGPTTVDYSTAADMLMTGKAAMLYNGSWFTQDLNNAQRNVAGPDGIGYFNIPLVAGGKGAMDDYSVNCGNIISFSKAKWDPAIADWVKFVFTRYGDYAINQQGTLKGFKVSKMPENLPSYTKLVAEEMKKVKNAGLWFEARLDDKSSKIAQDNGQALFIGAITPEDFFKQLDLSTKEFKASK
jgi:raffinose/stachyose/melibiose transport system substrate-binding protein